MADKYWLLDQNDEILDPGARITIPYIFYFPGATEYQGVQFRAATDKEGGLPFGSSWRIIAAEPEWGSSTFITHQDYEYAYVKNGGDFTSSNFYRSRLIFEPSGTSVTTGVGLEGPTSVIARPTATGTITFYSQPSLNPNDRIFSGYATDTVWVKLSFISFNGGWDKMILDSRVSDGLSTTPGGNTPDYPTDTPDPRIKIDLNEPRIWNGSAWIKPTSNYGINDIYLREIFYPMTCDTRLSSDTIFPILWYILREWNPHYDYPNWTVSWASTNFTFKPGLTGVQIVSYPPQLNIDNNFQGIINVRPLPIGTGAPITMTGTPSDTSLLTAGAATAKGDGTYNIPIYGLQNYYGTGLTVATKAALTTNPSLNFSTSTEAIHIRPNTQIFNSSFRRGQPYIWNGSSFREVAEVYTYGSNNQWRRNNVQT